jgi:mucin-19
MATTYIPLYTTTLASAASSVTISPISGAYTDLVLVVNYQDTRNVGGTDGFITVGNGSIDNEANYSYTVLRGNGSSATSIRASSANYIHTDGSGTQLSTVIANFQNYSNTTTFKTVLIRDNSANNRVDAVVGLWRSTSAINQIRFSGETGLAAGTTVSLYGVASAAVGAKATGGDFIGNDGSYFYHVFNASGTFTPLQSLTTDVLVIAGGGGGGGAVNGSIGGGGGAGGYQYFTGQAVTATGYSITVGAGGAGGSSSPGSGSNGSNSVFGALAASVGGGGGGSGHGTQAGNSGANGGSGGGAGFSATSTTVGGTGTAGQGNNGGNEGSGGGGAGGGGAGGAGSNPTAGAGLANSIAGSSITYAIGGAGSGSSGSGVTPSNPIANRGIGGDAGWNAAGGNGGSGIVIVRYPI